MSKTLVVRGAADQWSVRIQPAVLRICLALAALLCLSALVSLSLGSYPTTMPQIFQALSGAENLHGIRLILLEIRLPRILMAILAGGALGLAGLLLQGLVQNPLASPDVVGITSGASAAAVFTLW